MAVSRADRARRVRLKRNFVHCVEAPRIARHCLIDVEQHVRHLHVDAEDARMARKLLMCEPSHLQVPRHRARLFVTTGDQR